MSEEHSEASDVAALQLSEGVHEKVDESKSAPEDRAVSGPFDVSEVPAMKPYIDLGGIKVAPREGLQLRLDVDERAGRVVAVSLEYAESMLQVQAFAAPKSTGLWHRVRQELGQQMVSQGAEVSEEVGSLGPELIVRTAASAEQGGGARVIRFIAVDGPRWMLRGAITGQAGVDQGARERVYELFRELVVVRGEQPMPPSELLVLKVPAGVQQEELGAQTASTDESSQA